MTEHLKIIIACIAAAIIYGILHDQITARVCVEYFTVFHPPVFATQSPTLLACGWGVIATWWVGLFLGLFLAVAARIGPRPSYQSENCFAQSLAFFSQWRAVLWSRELQVFLLGWRYKGEVGCVRL